MDLLLLFPFSFERRGKEGRRIYVRDNVDCERYLVWRIVRMYVLACEVKRGRVVFCI